MVTYVYTAIDMEATKDENVMEGQEIIPTHIILHYGT